MRNLIAFLIKNSYWFLFILLQIACFFFIFKYNSYQRSIFFNSSNEITGRVYTLSGNVTSFFNLRQNNEELLLENAHLLQQVHVLENRIKSLSKDTFSVYSFLSDSTHHKNYEYRIARVVNNSISQVENYIIINKGEKDGIRSEMGVISQNGIVGFIRGVSNNYSVIQSVLNPKTQLNCKIKNSNTPSTLVWDTKDYRYANLQDFPRYEKYHKGDTVVTSGVSKFFPEGFIVGTVEESKAQNDDNFLTLRIKLATNFASLNDVLIIENYKQQEIINLKKEVSSNE